MRPNTLSFRPCACQAAETEFFSSAHGGVTGRKSRYGRDRCAGTGAAPVAEERRNGAGKDYVDAELRGMIYAVIMAGGSGTRFWPASRRAKPKQLLAISGDRTMIRATVERMVPEIPFHRTMVVTGRDHAAEIVSQVPELVKEMIVIEPRGKNTAPCVALAAYKLLKTDPDAVMVVLPADHLILDEAGFLDALRAAVEVASRGPHLVTFGVVPNRPETGYGYIKLGPKQLDAQSHDVFMVERFVEKPDVATAATYLASGQYLWNSGMFVWRAETIVKAFQELLPSVNDPIQKIVPSLNTPDEVEAVAAAYGEVESISIDYGILEKADSVLTMPIDVGWDDVGSWASLEKVWGCDEDGNAVNGDVLIVEAKGCIVSSPGKVTTLLGVDELVVVDTPDALMICRKDRAQDVRKIHELLKERGYGKLL